jgi:hypothetical protein
MGPPEGKRAQDARAAWGKFTKGGRIGLMFAPDAANPHRIRSPRRALANLHHVDPAI